MGVGGTGPGVGSGDRLSVLPLAQKSRSTVLSCGELWTTGETKGAGRKRLHPSAIKLIPGFSWFFCKWPVCVSLSTLLQLVQSHSHPSLPLCGHPRVCGAVDLVSAQTVLQRAGCHFPQLCLECPTFTPHCGTRSRGRQKVYDSFEASLVYIARYRPAMVTW